MKTTDPYDAFIDYKWMSAEDRREEASDRHLDRWWLKRLLWNLRRYSTVGQCTGFVLRGPRFETS